MPKKILLIGAGKSTPFIMRYFSKIATKLDITLTILDRNIEVAQKAAANEGFGNPISFDINDKFLREKTILEHDIIISMLPASMHLGVAKYCIEVGKNMVTASYISDEMKMLDLEAKKKGVAIINEVGVDPGIDHFSAMKIIDELKAAGNTIKAFETYTGGLVSPENDDNPWNYKFTWNPRNVVLAGNATAKYISNNKLKYIPYNRIFRRTNLIEIDQVGSLEGYPNRDSLKYRSLYGIKDIPTLLRGTLRKVGFSRAWSCFVDLGLTDDVTIIEDSENMTYREYINSFLPYNRVDTVETKFKYYLGIGQDDFDLYHKMEWLGIFSNVKVGLKNATPAQVLQRLLEEKLSLKANDKDMIVMFHKFLYQNQVGESKELHSSLVVKGDDTIYTAMAKTVGLPLSIVTKMLLNNQIEDKGVYLPIMKEIYIPVLKELEQYGISFQEKEVDLIKAQIE